MCIVLTVSHDKLVEIIAQSHKYVVDVYIYKKTLNHITVNSDATDNHLERKNRAIKLIFPALKPNNVSWPSVIIPWNTIFVCKYLTRIFKQGCPREKSFSI